LGPRDRGFKSRNPDHRNGLFSCKTGRLWNFLSIFHAGRDHLSVVVKAQSLFSAVQLLTVVAIHYIRNTQMTSNDIAFLLGYAELNSFLRAFTVWTGKSVSEYRKTLWLRLHRLKNLQKPAILIQIRRHVPVDHTSVDVPSVCCRPWDSPASVLPDSLRPSCRVWPCCAPAVLSSRASRREYICPKNTSVLLAHPITTDGCLHGFSW